MGYKDALRDSIPISKDSKGFLLYHPPCHICGSPVAVWQYIAGTVYTCKECRAEMVKQELQQKMTTEKKEKKLSEAIKRIAKVTDITAYDEAIATVSRLINKPQWFQSTEEIMVAIELLRRGVKVHHQVKVYDYRVDFVLPELHVALEIDGAIYHNPRNKREQIRDEVIADKLGAGWNVIRISDININENITKLLPAIHGVLEYRKKKSKLL